jgi:hypothetical protein
MGGRELSAIPGILQWRVVIPQCLAASHFRSDAVFGLYEKQKYTAGATVCNPYQCKYYRIGADYVES